MSTKTNRPLDPDPDFRLLDQTVVEGAEAALCSLARTLVAPHRLARDEQRSNHRTLREETKPRA